jgi:hypothetical protein
MPMRTRYLEVRLPQAVVLADLYEIRDDLFTTGHLCEKMRDARSLDESLVMDALFSAAVVKYARCFSDGVRRRLTERDIAILGSRELTEHRYFLALRHRLIAHAVSGLQETYVTVMARDKDGQIPPIEGLGWAGRKIAFTKEMANRLQALIRKVVASVAAMIASEETILLAHIQSLPLEEVHSWDFNRDQLPPTVETRRKRGANASGRRGRPKKENGNSATKAR